MIKKISVLALLSILLFSCWKNDEKILDKQEKWVIIQQSNITDKWVWAVWGTGSANVVSEDFSM